MYELSEKTKRNIESSIENALGIKYEEYKQLNYDEQQRLIAEYHKKNNSKKRIKWLSWLVQENMQFLLK